VALAPPLHPQVKDVVQEHVRQERRNHASNDIANVSGFLDRLIPRQSLRPGYGEGWKVP
jgi:hypothetical protein